MGIGPYSKVSTLIFSTNPFFKHKIISDKIADALPESSILRMSQQQCFGDPRWRSFPLWISVHYFLCWQESWQPNSWYPIKSSLGEWELASGNGHIGSTVLCWLPSLGFQLAGGKHRSTVILINHLSLVPSESTTWFWWYNWWYTFNKVYQCCWSSTVFAPSSLVLLLSNQVPIMP